MDTWLILTIVFASIAFLMVMWYLYARHPKNGMDVPSTYDEAFGRVTMNDID